jgi:hypothetical protein
MRRIVVLAVLAGCPAPPAPPAERPAPPAVVAIDAAPAPEVPAVLAVRSAGSALELVRVDASGEARVLHELGRTAGIPHVADLAVDPASGRYAVLVEADTVDGAATATPRNVMSLVLGRLDGGVVAVGPGDTKCVMHRCFESAVAIAPGGDTIITTLHRSSSSDLARYQFGPAPSPARLTAKGVEKPALSPDHARVAYLRGGAIYVAEVGSAAKPAPLVTGRTDVAALALGDDQLVYRTRAGAVVVVDVETQAARTAAQLAADTRPALRIGGDSIFTTDGGQVVAVPLAGGEPRDVAAGALVDVSADGAWLLVDDGALAVVAAADGRAAARLDVPAAFGEVRARLAPSNP